MLLTMRQNVMSKKLHLISNDQMHWRSCLIVRITFDVDVIECTDKIVCLSDCCIRPWNDQMHADDCLWRKPVAVSRLQRHSLWNCRRFCTRCWNRRMHWRLSVFRSVEAQRLSVDANEMILTVRRKCDARWLHSMLMHQMHWRNCFFDDAD